ncbi:Tim44 domain-containing protein [Martelella alba]|uniref:Tim44 domain-containing protein n=1 Tax=Martelella alba TaxID=2590451 RepID=A0A506U651_9HYPH|nr:Tim44/TimA family putative adaptor protein [Martelella alba]TPW28445.1 Tim44 domain-containing protein [Martelella alba]
MGTSDLITLFFLVAAVVIFFQLRNVLGRRTGNEKPRYQQSPMREAADAPQPAQREGKVITLPGAEKEREAQRIEAIDKMTAVGTPANEGLRSLVKADPQFDPAEFVKGARSAYEMIVMGFADGDRRTLKNLLSKEVFDGFNTAMSEREAKGESVKANFVGIEEITVTGAEMVKQEAQVTLRIVSQLISATYDKEGALVEGHPEEIAEVRDIWTFARDTRARDPNWKLIATASE